MSWVELLSISCEIAPHICRHRASLGHNESKPITVVNIFVKALYVYKIGLIDKTCQITKECMAAMFKYVHNKSILKAHL